MKSLILIIFPWSMDTLDHIFSRIMETPINAYDAETVILVHDFTVIGVKANVCVGPRWHRCPA